MDNRSRDDRYTRKDAYYIPGYNNISIVPLVGKQNVLLPPGHIKLRFYNTGRESAVLLRYLRYLI